MSDSTTRFAALFAGHQSYYGTYELVPGTVPGQKARGQAHTRQGRATLQHFRAHLRGAMGIGIVPITAQNTMSFGAIDIDKYDMEYRDVIDALGPCPVVPCRTKSGGLHLYVFFAEPVPAKQGRAVLSELAAALGFGGVEIFPKQEQLAEGAVGNWINLPYFDADNTQRHALDKNAQPLGLDAFLTMAEERRTTIQVLREAMPGAVQHDPLAVVDGPPCLVTLTREGFAEGTRNNGLFALATYYKKRAPSEWERLVLAANDKWMGGQGTVSEAVHITNQIRKRDYQYRCSDMPLCDHCDRSACLRRKFGVTGPGGAGANVTVTDVEKSNTQPPQYFVTIEGVKAGPLDVEDIIEQRRWQRVVANHTALIPRSMKQRDFHDRAEEILQSAVIIDIGEEASNEGRLFGLVREFIHSRKRSEDMERLVTGAVFADGTFCHFRLQDFEEFSRTRAFRAYTPAQMAALFKSHGMVQNRFRIKGHHVRTWGIQDDGPPPEIGAAKTIQDEVL